ncbi:kinase-like domain-containing protein [Sporodiniella umbellata]|nr:kinase-like domain-containing protein [Sporodiniella umbellata]
MGVGAFSIVYRSLDHKSNQEVAIKVVHKQDLSRSLKANVLKEAQIMRTLGHPSIIQFLAFKETTEYYYLVLELMPGGEIFHQLAQLTYFSEDLTRHCIKQVAEGIRYLHEEKGVVHRDIKPENILFEKIPFIERQQIPTETEECKKDEGECVFGVGGGGIGKVKLADFGLSKIVWDQQTMTPCGTVGYTAPEIVRDERYSKSVDMWALGCVMYTMLCGFPPFYDESISALTNKVAQGQFTFPSPWWDPISSRAKDLIRHLLEVQPKKRYTIDQFLAHPWLARWDSSTCSAQRPRKELPFSLKNTFDVSYAVHRMSEERAHQKETKQKKNRWHLFGSRRSPQEKSPLDSPVGFDLNLNHATLLGRRNQRLPAPIK